ncbi:hypothetical protein VCV18_001454 [Metarhizium anisopliae]
MVRICDDGMPSNLAEQKEKFNVGLAGHLQIYSVLYDDLTLARNGHEGKGEQWDMPTCGSGTCLGRHLTSEVAKNRHSKHSGVPPSLTRTRTRTGQDRTGQDRTGQDK